MAAPVFRFPVKTKASSEESAAGPATEFGSNPPSQFKFTQSQTTHDDGESIWLLSYADMMTLLFSFFALLMSFSKIDVDSFEKVRKETTEIFGGEYQRPFEQIKKELKEQVRLQGLTDKAIFDDIAEGLTITFRGSVFFDPGSADLKDEAMTLLRKVIPTVQNQKMHFNIVVEGHTDDNPIHSDRYPSNWELSGNRAAAVLRLFEENGFARSQLKAIGYADTVPVAPNRTAEGSPITDNQGQNRRIVIKLIRNLAK